MEHGHTKNASSGQIFLLASLAADYSIPTLFQGHVIKQLNGKLHQTL